MDWAAWHAAYDDPSSPLSERLRRVRSHLSAAIDRAPAGRVSLVSLCAGQGHDVLGDSFADALPADVLLLCGIFGNVTDRAIQRTVQAAPALCHAGATVIWTRHRRPPDVTPQIREWFAEGGFEEVAFDALDVARQSVGVNRLHRATANTPPDQSPT